MTNNTNYGLGRLPEFDERSRNFPIRMLVESKPPRSYTWSCQQVLNQGAEGSCVGHAWAHELAARPIVWPASSYLARLIYKEAQKIDEWAGEAYEGTSVLAGVKIAKNLGHYSVYRWAFSLNDLVLAVGYEGPAVIGIPWYESMFDPDADGMLHVSGNVAGGHALLVNGTSITSQKFRLHNSWGYDWGLNGEAFISFSDMERLLNENGEACIPTRM